MSTIPQHTRDEIAEVNASGRTPVVFIHGLWLLPSSWDRWAEVFGEAGLTPLTPGWPDDPETVEDANAHPDVFAGKGVGQVAVAVPLSGPWARNGELHLKGVPLSGVLGYLADLAQFDIRVDDKEQAFILQERKK